jgi:hypothetical protein
MKFILLIIIVIFNYTFSYSQNRVDIPYQVIIQNMEFISLYIKSQQIHISMDDSGKRYIYITQKDVDGLENDEWFVGLWSAERYANVLYVNTVEKLETSISFKTFIDILSSKNIVGVKYETKTNVYQYFWEEILNQHNTKKNK